ncbi:MAG: bifunctional phosphopantothenoylcysteine decarboxylase/phosphopantothenate--cysteine ligase CoaBC [Actinomycetota bacterium]
MRILLGITGGISAYKAAGLVRGFSELGHTVTVLPTENALKFVGKATLESLSGNPIDIDMYSDVAQVRHVELGQQADLIVVAPATASFLARLSSGLADDLLMNALLASSSPVILCPAMHTEMWLNPATIANVETLRSRGVTIMEPAVGRLTGEDSGPGRLPEVAEILAFVNSKLSLAGKRILVTAGGTREPIDAVRYIGNSSTGRQGVEIAKAARDMGAEVTLIAANVSVALPRGVNVIEVSTVRELQTTMTPGFDALIMAAAVSDFHVANQAEGKLPSKVLPNIILGENPDLVAQYAAENPDTYICGFALEEATGPELIYRAKQKLGRKNLDMIVANSLSALGAKDNSVTFITADSEQRVTGDKQLVAKELIGILAQKLS